MTNFWKIASIILLGICIGMGYLLYKERSKELKANQMSLKDIDVNDYQYKVKQDPKAAQDVNDYFYRNQTKIRFLQDLYDFDSIPKGKHLIKEISYVNEGTQPYFITDIKASCGCTIPSYDKKPIQPSDTGYLTIDFNSTTKEGLVMNKLTLYGNVENNEKSTYFKVYVKSKNH